MSKPITVKDYGTAKVCDFVKCNNCGTHMLLPVGAEKCPDCHTEGVLAWVDEDNHEVEFEAVIRLGYKIESCRVLVPSDYLTKETIDSL